MAPKLLQHEYLLSPILWSDFEQFRMPGSIIYRELLLSLTRCFRGTSSFAKLGRHASPIMICVRCDHHHSFLATVLVSHCGEVLFWGRYIVRFPRAPRGTISQQYIQYMYFRHYIMIFSLYGHTVVLEADSLALLLVP